ncbi:hypothetical protein Btru_048173 [Bulinus truncatus]|nr:hypothetical protein Btru_048173 [Bulinus truncatus]
MGYTQDDKEEINTGSSRSAKNGTFLDLLIRKSTSSPSVRDVFIKALQYYQPDLLLRLKKPQLTYADALKKPDSTVPTWRQMPVHKCESSGIDVDLRLLDPHYILTLVCSVEKKLNELLASQQLNELKKYLCHLTYIFNCQSYAPILEDFIKDSLLHKRLFDICKQPLTENLQETNNNYLDIGLSSLQLTSIISGQHVAFCQHLCEKENILFLFDILKEVHTTVHSRNARLERKGIDMQTASLLIFYNIVLNKNKFDHIITESTFLHTLRIYMKSEESVHRVTSILIMIHLNTFCESTLGDCAKDILTALTSWLKATLEDSKRVKNPRPDATAVIRGLKKLATIQIFSTKMQENQYIMSLSKSNCWTKKPTAAAHFIKLLSKLNLIGARNNKELHFEAQA